MKIQHMHKYEAVSHPKVSPEIGALGVKGVEMRKCEACGRVMPFVQIKGNKWTPLFEEESPDEQEILLA